MPYKKTYINPILLCRRLSILFVLLGIVPCVLVYHLYPVLECSNYSFLKRDNVFDIQIYNTHFTKTTVDGIKKYTSKNINISQKYPVQGN